MWAWMKFVSRHRPAITICLFINRNHSLSRALTKCFASHEPNFDHSLFVITAIFPKAAEIRHKETSEAKIMSAVKHYLLRLSPCLSSTYTVLSVSLLHTHTHTRTPSQWECCSGRRSQHLLLMQLCTRSQERARPSRSALSSGHHRLPLQLFKINLDFKLL